MNLSFLFDKGVKEYDKFRPDYPEELFADIINYSKITNESAILEIGCGTGQATKSFIDKNFNVLAIELGENLAEFTKKKFKNYNNFLITNRDYMDFELKEECADLIFAATSFHWLPEDLALDKIKSELKLGGTLALFWNHPYPNRDDDETNLVNKKVYEKHRGKKDLKEFSLPDTEAKLNLLKKHGFVNVTSKIYKRVRTLETEEYIGLIRTYSDHLALPKKKQKEFETDMRKAINSVGGKINIYDTIDLYLAKK